MPCMHALEAAHHVLLVAVGNMPCACAGLLLVVQQCIGKPDGTLHEVECRLDGSTYTWGANGGDYTAAVQAADVLQMTSEGLQIDLYPEQAIRRDKKGWVRLAL